MAESYEELFEPDPTTPKESAYEDLIRQQTGEAYKPAPGNIEEQSKRDYKQLGKAGLIGAASFAGGMAAAPYGVARQLIGEAAGAGLGDLLGQGVFDGEFDLPQAGKTSALTLGFGALGRTIAETYGALGGIPPKMTRNVGRMDPVRGYRATFRGPGEREHLELGRRIGSTMEESFKDVTQPRQALEQMIATRTNTGGRISVKPIIDALDEAKVVDPVMPEVAASNRLIDDRIVELRRIEQSQGGMTATELDRLINQELDPSAFKASGEVSQARLGYPYTKAREAARVQLLKNLPDEAASLRQQVDDELTWRDIARTHFGTDRPGRTVVGNLKNIDNPGSEEVKQSLQFVSKQTGIDFSKMAEDLATRSSYSFDDRVKLNVMNRIVLGLGLYGAAHGNPVGIAALSTSPAVSHVVSKIVAPLQSVAGPGGVTLYEALKKEYGLRGAPSPDGDVNRVIANSPQKVRVRGAGRAF